MDEREKTINIQLASMDKALGIATREMERRLEGMNEFREQLSKQAATFIPLKEANLLLENVESKNSMAISELGKRINDRLDSVIREVDEVQQCLSTDKGSSKWRDHIVTVLVTMAVMAIMQYIFKI
jgi:anti-sigma-K factor RskA